jgi:hypothetical protein
MSWSNAASATRKAKADIASAIHARLSVHRFRRFSRRSNSTSGTVILPAVARGRRKPVVHFGIAKLAQLWIWLLITRDWRCHYATSTNFQTRLPLEDFHTPRLPDVDTLALHTALNVLSQCPRMPAGGGPARCC